MNHPRFGRTEDRIDYKGGRPSDILKRVFRNGEEVIYERWQEEKVKVRDKAQASAIVILGFERLFSGEWLAFEYDAQPDPRSEAILITQRWRTQGELPL